MAFKENQRIRHMQILTRMKYVVVKVEGIKVEEKIILTQRCFSLSYLPLMFGALSLSTKEYF